MADFLTSFYPICCTAYGRRAAAQHNLHWFIDGSCRREPDFEKRHPAITSLCRPGFSDRLVEGSKVIYMTNAKGVGGNYVVAVLEVLRIVVGHQQAADYYHLHSLGPVPQNHMISENQPFPLEYTHNMGPWDRWVEGITVAQWDETYRSRAENFEQVAICQFIYRPLLDAPRRMSAEEKQYIFGRNPGTLTPPALRPGEWDRFQERLPFFPVFERV